MMVTVFFFNYVLISVFKYLRFTLLIILSQIVLVASVKATSSTVLHIAVKVERLTCDLGNSGQITVKLFYMVTNGAEIITFRVYIHLCL